jgi:hypothetical protein
MAGRNTSSKKSPILPETWRSNDPAAIVVRFFLSAASLSAR